MFDELPFEPGAHTLRCSFESFPVNVGRLERTQPVASGPKFQDRGTGAMVVNVLRQVLRDEFAIENDVPWSMINGMLRGVAIQQIVLLLQIRACRMVHIDIFLGPIVQGAMMRTRLGS
jgi:hypothetical protein